MLTECIYVGSRTLCQPSRLGTFSFCSYLIFSAYPSSNVTLVLCHYTYRTRFIANVLFLCCSCCCNSCCCCCILLLYPSSTILSQCAYRTVTRLQTSTILERKAWLPEIYVFPLECVVYQCLYTLTYTRIILMYRPYTQTYRR